MFSCLLGWCGNDDVFVEERVVREPTTAQTAKEGATTTSLCQREDIT